MPSSSATDYRALQGAWEQVALEDNGVLNPPDAHSAPGAITTISADTFEVVTVEGETLLAGRFVLDADTTPKSITWVDAIGADAGKSLPASYHLDGKVDGRTIQNRKRKLMAAQKKISRAKNRKLIGNELPVLLEGPSQETDLLWECRMPSQAPEIDGMCYVNDLGQGDAAPGQFRRLRITEAHDYDVVGELIDDAPLNPGSQPQMFRILASA